MGWMHSRTGTGGGLGAASLLAALLLAAAGLYQFTPWKRRSMATGAGPLPFLLLEAPEWTNGAAFQAGLDTGIARLAWSGPLLAVLLVVGLVNPAWLLILALVVAVETRTREVAFSRAVGAALVVLGVVAAVSPGALHALSGV
jgi:predicted metal-binding membrane protein